MPEANPSDFAVTLTAPRQVTLSEYRERELEANQVRLKTLYSGISAGTELSSYRGSNPLLNKRWDTERRLFVNDGDLGPPHSGGDAGAGNILSYPLDNWGYEEVGRVVELGADVTKVKLGDTIWGTWSHKSSHLADEEWASERVLPASLDPICGIFSHVGAIALNVVLDADIHVGEYVAVFGQGVMGLTVTQLARLNGGTVIAVDGIAKRLELGRALGAEYAINFQEQDAAEEIKRLTDNRGADVSIEITGSYNALHNAIRATAYNSRVIAAGFYQGEGRGLALGEEFHHNRIQIISSQISGSAPHLSHRWNRLRLNHTVMNLQAQGRIDLKRLITHIIPARDAAEAFRLLDENPNDAVQVVLQFF
jgi:2-desacetyl-2-hydroxyethyl bacteriochlorophyllide A dehydrogenase